MKVKCRHCGAIVELNKDVKMGTKTIDEKNKVTVAYAECPKCDSKIYFQLNNEYTLHVVERLAKRLNKIEKDKAENKEPNTRLYEEASGDVFKLKFIRTLIEKKYKNEVQIAEVIKDV